MMFLMYRATVSLSIRPMLCMPGVVCKQRVHCFRHMWELLASSRQDVHRVCIRTLTVRLSDYRWCWQRTYEWTCHRYQREIGRSTLLIMSSKVCKNNSKLSLAWSLAEWDQLSRVKRSFIKVYARDTRERETIRLYILAFVCWSSSCAFSCCRYVIPITPT